MKVKHHKSKTCSNCNYEYQGADNYCPVCGQKNHELKIPLKHLIEEFIESTLHLDNKIFSTLKYLLFYPGQLSKEYNDGKRVKFVAPVRLYIIISFLFFLLLNISTPKKSATTNNSTNGKNETTISINISGISSAELTGLTKTQVDSLIKAKRIKQTFYNKYLILQLYKISNGSMGEFIHSFIKNVSYMMFALMPGFAFLIFIFFKKRTKYFIESLILSIHFHSFIFLLVSFFIVIALIKTIYFILLTPIIVVIYLFLMLRKYYEQKVLVILGKTIAIGILHLILFILMFLCTMIISVAII